MGQKYEKYKHLLFPFAKEHLRCFKVNLVLLFFFCFYFVFKKRSKEKSNKNGLCLPKVFYFYAEKIIVAYLKNEIPFALQSHSLLLRFDQT